MKRKKKPFKTAAQLLFSDHEILLARPAEMSFKEYKILQYTQHLVLRKMFKQCPSKKLMDIIPGHLMYRTKRAR